MRRINKTETPVIREFKVGGVVVNVDYILNCPYEDIREAAEQIPAYLGWFAHQKACAHERLINAKYKRDQAEARAYFELKGGQFLARGYGEKMTETALDKAVMLDPTVEAAVDHLKTCQKNFDWLNGTIDSLMAKLELVRSTEATRRMEHEPDKNRNSTE